MLSKEIKATLDNAIAMYDSTYKTLVETEEYIDFAAVETSLKDTVNTQLQKGTDPAELRTRFTVETESIAYFNRLVTIHNAKENKTGKTGGGGGSKSQKKKTGKASTAAKKTAKKSATIQEATIDATLAAVKANLETNFAESKIDGKRKSASVAEIEIIGKLIAKSVRSIADKTAIVTDALPKAKVSKDKTPSKSNGKAKTPKVHAGNRIAKELASVK